MIDLTFESDTILVVCADCAQQWRIDPDAPFMRTLRTLVESHLCPGVLTLPDARPRRLQGRRALAPAALGQQNQQAQQDSSRGQGFASPPTHQT